MKCKYCFAEVEDGATVCPACGKELNVSAEETVQEELTEVAEETSVKGKKPIDWKQIGKKTLAVAGVVVLALVLTGAILHFMGLGKQALHYLKFWRPNDLNYKLSYSVEDEVAEKKQQVVIATVGDQELTNGELQAHYWSAVYDFLSMYGNYIGYGINMDLSKPLDEQIYDEATGQTYQQKFLEIALDNWHRDAVLVELSKEAGFSLSEEEKAYVESVKTNIEELAKQYQYTDVEAFIDKELFPGCSLDSYMKYTRMSYLALDYYGELYDSLNPPQEQIEAYYTANEAKLKEMGFGKDAGNYYNVRHILIDVKSEKVDEGSASDYSEEEWEACRKEAQDLLDQFLAGEATEKAFGELAKEHSKDPGSASKGGLYEKLTESTGFIQGFKDWYLAEDREPGDTGLVKNTQSTTQGYHIMYFCGSTTIWEPETKDTMTTEHVNKQVTEGQTKWPMKVDYKKIALSQVELLAQ